MVNEVPVKEPAIVRLNGDRRTSFGRSQLRKVEKKRKKFWIWVWFA